jgi:hypothetical protein
MCDVCMVVVHWFVIVSSRLQFVCVQSTGNSCRHLLSSGCGKVLLLTCQCDVVLGLSFTPGAIQVTVQRLLCVLCAYVCDGRLPLGSLQDVRPNQGW